jgi:DNA-binding NarL/FixJ family response regulator
MAAMASSAHAEAGSHDACVRVLLGAGHLLLREGLAHVLDGQEQLEIVGLFTTESALAACIEATSPDVLVISAALPPDYCDEGVRLATRLRRERPEIGCVLLGDSLRPADFLSFVADGMAGCAYLLMQRIESADEIVHAVRTVAAGGSVVDPIVVEQLAAEPDESTRMARLTSREIDVLELVAEGRSNAAIAKSLGMTTRAVEKHISEIFVRLDFQSGSDLSRRVAATLIFLRASGRLALSG